MTAWWDMRGSAEVVSPTSFVELFCLSLYVVIPTEAAFRTTRNLLFIQGLNEATRIIYNYGNGA
jgi:hypothetical protein